MFYQVVFTLFYAEEVTFYSYANWMSLFR